MLERLREALEGMVTLQGLPPTVRGSTRWYLALSDIAIEHELAVDVDLALHLDEADLFEDVAWLPSRTASKCRDPWRSICGY